MSLDHPEGNPDAAHERSQSSAAHKVLGTAVTRSATLVGAAISGILVARVLGPTGQGVVAVVMALVATAEGLGNMSLTAAEIYLWTTSPRREALSANALPLGILAGIVVATLTGAATHLVSGKGLPGGDIALLAAGLCALPVLFSGGWLAEIMRLAGQIGTLNLAQLLASVAEAILVVAFVVTGHLTVLTAVLAWTISTFVPMPIIVWATKPRARYISASVARRTIGVGLQYHPGTVFLRLLYRLDVLILTIWVGTAQIGLYAVAVTLAEMTVIGTDAVAFALRDRQIGLPVAEGAHLTIRLSRINLIVGTVSFAALAAVSGVAIPLVYGHAYSGAVTALYALGPGVIALASMRAVSAHLVRLERPGVFATLTGLAVAINAGLNVALIPSLGIVGASLASSVSYVVLAVACLTWLCRSVGAPLIDIAPRWRDLADIWDAGRQLMTRYRARARLATPTSSGPTEGS